MTVAVITAMHGQLGHISHMAPSKLFTIVITLAFNQEIMGKAEPQPNQPDTSLFSDLIRMPRPDGQAT